MRPLAIFDIDGTLVDSRAVISGAMRDAFLAHGLTPPAYEQTRKIVGLSLLEAVDKLAPRDMDHDDLLVLVERYKDAFVSARTSGNDFEPLYAGALDVLTSLKDKGWKIGVATGKSRRGLDAIIDKHSFERFFDAHYCADDGPGKPHPYMVQANLDALDSRADHAVMIGDTSFDMIMAKAAGVATIGVDWGFHTAQEVKASGADYLVSTMDALNERLLNFANNISVSS
ncbi:HAD-IA family hydrolase [Fretibacter rubidus]|uniref:HAD-IA family hydrolase n=1 Tax=Fretibacter rubidus TaxID=570162 RepID=UPI00352AADC7